MGGVVVSGARLPLQRVSSVFPSMTATHMPISLWPGCSAFQTASMSSSILALTELAAADAGSAAANAAARAKPPTRRREMIDMAGPYARRPHSESGIGPKVFCGPRWHW